MAAFAFFGGVPARIVPDNLATGVRTPRPVRPEDQPGVCRAGRALRRADRPGAGASNRKDKPRVERPMPYVRDSFWRGREFTSLAQMQAAAVRWCRDVAGARACRPLDGAAPAAVFAAVEADSAATVAASGVRAGDVVDARGRPGHPRQGRQDAVFGAVAAASAERVDARATATMVQIFRQRQLIATHGRKPSGQTDRPGRTTRRRRSRSAMRTPTWCRTRADEIGPAAAR